MPAPLPVSWAPCFAAVPLVPVEEALVPVPVLVLLPVRARVLALLAPAQVLALLQLVSVSVSGEAWRMGEWMMADVGQLELSL